MDKIFEGTALGMIGRLGNELTMIKAMNYVQLKHFAIQNNLDLEDLLKEVEQMHAQYMFQLTKIFEEILEKAQNPDKPDSDLEQYLK